MRCLADFRIWSVPSTRWLRPTAWLPTWRNIDDFVEETRSPPPEVQQRTGQPLTGHQFKALAQVTTRYGAVALSAHFVSVFRYRHV